MVKHSLKSLKNLNFFRPFFNIMHERVNPLMFSVPHHAETSQLICSPDQFTGFYKMGNIGRERVKLKI